VITAADAWLVTASKAGLVALAPPDAAKAKTADVDAMLASAARRMLGTDATQTTYVSHDHLGSASLETSERAEVKARRWHGPYGEVRGAMGAWAEARGFTGKERDEATGLADHGARYLDTRLGRWTAPDPLAVRELGGAELDVYGYVDGRVSAATDPTGLFKLTVHREVTNNAIRQSGNTLLWVLRDQVQKGHEENDGLAGQFHPEYHMDDSHIREGVTFARQELKFARNATKLGDYAFHIGRALHTVQDFYAHSNYANLWLEFGETGRMPLVSDVFNPHSKEYEKWTGFRAHISERGGIRTGKFSMMELYDYMTKVGHGALANDEPPSDRLKARDEVMWRLSSQLFQLKSDAATRESARTIQSWRVLDGLEQAPVGAPFEGDKHDAAEGRWDAIQAH
jgi:RHS repeat-associated protein